MMPPWVVLPVFLSSMVLLAIGIALLAWWLS